MKKILLALLLLGATTGTASAQVEIGLKLSPSVTCLRADVAKQYTFQSEKSKLGIRWWPGGRLFLWCKLRFWHWLTADRQRRHIILPGEFYHSRTTEQKISLQYLEVPLTVKLFTNDITTDTKLYFQLGVQNGALLAARIDGNKFYITTATKKSREHFIIPRCRSARWLRRRVSS